MRYSNGAMSLETEAVIEYPYTTYYRRKIMPVEYDGTVYRPLAELRLPLLVLQYRDRCDVFHLDPIIETEDATAYPFIGFNRERERFEVILPRTYRRKRKQSEWLGIGATERVQNPVVREYEPDHRVVDDWQDAVTSFYDQRLEERELSEEKLREIFQDARQALFRGWDEDLGTFLQLPWRDRPGFALDAYSYSLMANEAVRLDYFRQLYERTGEKQFAKWADRLEDLFKDESLYMKDLEHGEGLVWYNTATYDGNSLQGRFYLETGYYGYPGGQATIALHLLRALERSNDPDLEERVRESLEYILSTQQEDGRWPTTLRQEWELPFKRTRVDVRESEGATAECCRALMAAYERFEEEKFLESAFEGLETLADETPICYNGLRDIGTNETEAFSAFAVIHAFLDAYEIQGEERYLDQAETYAAYLSTWNYWYTDDRIDLRGINHPIAETITMRASPFETVLAARAFRRLAEATGAGLWERLYRLALDRGMDLVNRSGGLSEGRFFSYEEGFLPLETEQTFATAELLYTVSNELSFDDKRSAADEQGDDASIEQRDGAIVLPELETVFDPASMTFRQLFGQESEARLEFAGPHTWRSRTGSRITGLLRGHDLLLGLSDLSYLWEGIRPEESRYTYRGVESFTNQPRIDVGETASFTVDTGVYTIEGEISGSEAEKRLEIALSIVTERHDLRCDGVRFSMPGFTQESDQLRRGDVVARMEQAIPVSKGFDLSLSTNWTHGGIFEGEIVLEESGS
ncbi:MAG: hypothetical protein SVU32_06110 [Candidatus Nanohaloarchaea archaeon]|nr:hypothetical protein [Candidatus Nanohaloarchaea archaeon]